jgi:hypothetical protein
MATAPIITRQSTTTTARRKDASGIALLASGSRASYRQQSAAAQPVARHAKSSRAESVRYGYAQTNVEHAGNVTGGGGGGAENVVQQTAGTHMTARVAALNSQSSSFTDVPPGQATGVGASEQRVVRVQQRSGEHATCACSPASGEQTDDVAAASEW